MIVCAYEYKDGICGVTEVAHSENLNALARHGHTFTGAEIRREVDENGRPVFTRAIKAGQVAVVPIEVLDAVMRTFEMDRDNHAKD